MTDTSLFRRARDHALLRVDLASWRRQMRQARSRAAPSAEKTVLFCDLLTSVATAKAEAVYASALRQCGYAPTVLLPRPAWSTEACFEAAGPTRFVYLDDYVSRETLRRGEAEVDQILEAIPDPNRLLDFELDGFRIGRNVLSMVMRTLRVGRLDPGNGDHRRLTRKTLAESLAVKAAADEVLNDIAPDLLMVNERGYTPAGEIFDACLSRGVDTVQWLGAPRSDHLLFKRYGLSNRDVHPLALSDETWSWLKDATWTEENDRSLIEYLRSNYASGAWFNRQKLQEGKVVKSKSEIVEQLGLDPEKKTAVIFCHILYDATFFYGRSLFADYEEWLVESVRSAIANPNLNWVVKAHPGNVWRSGKDRAQMEQLELEALGRAFGELPPHVRFMPAGTDINTWSLFEAIDYGLTVRGTIGMELPCFGISVVTAGTGRYSNRGFTIDPVSPEEFRQVLLTLHERPRLSGEVVALARRYAFGTFFLRPIKIESFEFDFHANSYGVQALSQNVRLMGGNTPIEEYADMRHLATWLNRENHSDYLEPDRLTALSPERSRVETGSA